MMVFRTTFIRRMRAYGLRFPIALLSLSAGAGGAQLQPQTSAMTLGVARSGVVQAIDVADGEHVEAGRVLVVLDCGPLAKDIGVRAASLQAAEANYERVLNGPRPEEIAIGEAGVGVAVARAEEARSALDRADAMEVGVSITLAQRLVVKRDSARSRRTADGRAQEACFAQGRVARRGRRGS